MIFDIINKKEHKKQLTYEELSFFFNGYLKGNITDDDMTKLLKAIMKNNLSIEEIYDLTDIFIKSGDVLNIPIDPCVDKHSTGGIGDKTTLIVAPIVASLGIYMPKLSGRGLGYTGGTIDKLESINVNTNLTEDEFITGVKKIGFSITGQTKNLCPMDKKVYALRDVTNTTENIGLIATSIMSKKIAGGAKNIVIDLKVGNGALIKNKKDAKKLAKIMINIGKKYNRKVVCVLTDMNNPLGSNIGNLLEVEEAVAVLNNKVRNNLYNLCVYLSSVIVEVGLNISFNSAKEMVIDAIESGKAYQKFLDFIEYQNGDLNLLEKHEEGYQVLATKSGYIKNIDALKFGILSMNLGAGRKNKDDKIDFKAGIVLNKQVGDYVKENELLCTLYGKDEFFQDTNQYFEIVNRKQKNKNIVISIIR